MNARLAQEVRELAARQLGSESVATGLDLDALDSLQRLELAVAVEDHFRIRLDEADEQYIESLSQLVEVIERKLR